MSYQLQNALNQFDFTDSVIQEITFGLDSLHIHLENVKILPENYQNRDIVKVNIKMLVLDKIIMW